MPNPATDPVQLHSHDLKNTRDLRTLLLEAAYALLERPAVSDTHVYLHHCTLAKKRVAMESEQLKRIALPKIAQRIHLAVDHHADGGVLPTQSEHLSPQTDGRIADIQD